MSRTVRLPFMVVPEPRQPTAASVTARMSRLERKTAAAFAALDGINASRRKAAADAFAADYTALPPGRWDEPAAAREAAGDFTPMPPGRWDTPAAAGPVDDYAPYREIDWRAR